MSELYKVLSSTEDCIIIAVNEKTSYTLSPAAFALCEMAIKGGGNPDEVFALQASMTAKSVKAFDPEKAAAKAKREKVNAAIEQFNAALANHVWSDAVDKAIADYQDAQAVAEDAASWAMPILDLNTLRRLDGKLAVNDAEVWSFREITRGGSKFYVYEVAAKAPADHVANMALQDARATLQFFAHSEALDLADPILASEVKVTSLDIDDVGNIIFDAKVKRSGSSGNGGPRKRVEYVDEGNNVHVFASKTELGEYLGATSKWVHASKEVKEAFASGKAKLLDD